MASLRCALLGAVLAFVSLSGCERFSPGSGSGETHVHRDVENAGIVGGTLVDREDPLFNVMTKILFSHDDGTYGLCSGTLVHPRFVLTAAHCLVDHIDGPIDPSSIQLASGQALSIEGVHVHPKYDPSQRFNRYDIALIEVTAASALQFAVLGKPDETASEGSKTFVAGFGRTSYDAADRFPRLKKLEAEVVKTDFSESEQLIFNGADTGTCFGDSGGPFYEQIGSTIRVLSVLSREAPGNKNCVGMDLQTKTSAVWPWFTQAFKGELTARAKVKRKVPREPGL